MTLEELTRIIIEAVERAMALQKLHVGVCVFDAANAEKVREAALSLNGKCLLRGAETCVCDVVFTDALPVSHFAKLALGIIDDEQTHYLHGTVMNGGAVFVLGAAPAALEKTPPSCAALLEKYKIMLESYGYVFLGEEKNAPEAGQNPGARTDIFDLRHKRVMGGTDLATLPNGCRVYANSGAVITGLAADMARDKKIVIERH